MNAWNPKQKLSAIVAIQNGTPAPSWFSPTNQRGYANPNMQLCTEAGAQAFLDQELAAIDKLPASKRSSIGYLFWDFGGYLNSEIQSYPIMPADGIAMSVPGWNLISQAFAARGIPFGIEARPTQNLNGAADITREPDRSWQKVQNQRMIALFPKNAEVILYFDSADCNPTDGPAVETAMSDFGQNVLALPEAYDCTIAQRQAYLKICNGMYFEVMNQFGDCAGIKASDVKALMQEFPNAIFAAHSYAGSTGIPAYSADPALLISLNMVPMVGSASQMVGVIT